MIVRLVETIPAQNYEFLRSSTLYAVGTPQEKIVFRSSRENKKKYIEIGGVLLQRAIPKVQLEHAEVTGSYNGLYIEDLGGSKTDTMYIRHNIFENIADYALRTEWGYLEYECRD